MAQLSDAPLNPVTKHPIHDMQERIKALESKVGSFGGGGSGMDPDIAVLKHRADASDQRLVRVEDKLDRVLEAVSKLPTTNGLWGMIATVLALCVAAVGTMIAVLTWVQGFHH